MSIIVDQFKKIQSNIEKLQLDNSPKIIAVSKTFSLEHIKPLIAYGHNHFGENKVQEANSKWQDLLLKNDNISQKGFENLKKKINFPKSLEIVISTYIK